MPVLILGDSRKGWPKSSGCSSIQTLSSFCQSVSGPSILLRVLDDHGKGRRAARRRRNGCCRRRRPACGRRRAGGGYRTRHTGGRARHKQRRGWRDGRRQSGGCWLAARCGGRDGRRGLRWLRRLRRRCGGTAGQQRQRQGRRTGGFAHQDTGGTIGSGSSTACAGTRPSSASESVPAALVHRCEFIDCPAMTPGPRDSRRGRCAPSAPGRAPSRRRWPPRSTASRRASLATQATSGGPANWPSADHCCIQPTVVDSVCSLGARRTASANSVGRDQAADARRTSAPQDSARRRQGHAVDGSKGRHGGQRHGDEAGVQQARRPHPALQQSARPRGCRACSPPRPAR